MSDIDIISNLDNEKFEEKPINLINIYKTIARNKILYFMITGSTIFASLILAFAIKKVWGGQFQIVINEKNKSISISPQLANLAGIDIQKGNALNTQVEILKSPSVLMPVFEFAKAQEKNPSAKNLSFSNWKNENLDIKLEKKTSILNITYRNTNKNSIIPVLNKMSNSYQDYSGKNKRRSQELTNNFLKEQIKIFKKKSANSLKAAQEFAIDQDLAFYDLGKESKNYNTDNSKIDPLIEAPNLLLPNIGIENARVQAANQIRKINLQLKKIKELNDSEELYYIGSTIPALVEEGLPKALSDIESDILGAKSKYTDKDITIINLIKKRKLLIDLLKNRTIKYLEVQKLNAEATMKAAMRPKGVLLKYKELIRKSARDEQTLIKLEDRFNLFKLELASQEDPWELITKPTLLENRVSPNRKNILFIGFIFSNLLAFLIIKGKEKLSGKVYDHNEISNILEIPIILDLTDKKNTYINDLISLYFTNISRNYKISKVKLIPFKNVNLKKVEDLKSILNALDKKISCEITDNLVKNQSDDLQLLIAGSGPLDLEELINFKNKLKLQINSLNNLIII